MIALVGALLASVREVLRVAPRTSPRVPAPVLLVPFLERLPDTAQEQKEDASDGSIHQVPTTPDTFAQTTLRSTSCDQ